MKAVKSEELTDQIELEEPVEYSEPTKRELISTEFRPYFVGIKPLHFEIHTCPFCGLTGNIDRFVGSTVPPVEDDLRAFLLDHILPVLRQDLSWMSFSGERFEFLAMIMEYQGAEPQRIGLQYLKAAWCAKDLFHKKELHYRMRMTDFFRKALPDRFGGTGDLSEYGDSNETDDLGDSSDSIALPPERRALLKYMIGEQYRRGGHPEQAAEWYDQAQSLADKYSLLAALADQQKTNPQEYLNEKQQMAVKEVAGLELVLDNPEKRKLWGIYD